MLVCLSDRKCLKIFSVFWKLMTSLTMLSLTSKIASKLPSPHPLLPISILSLIGCFSRTDLDLTIWAWKIKTLNLKPTCRLVFLSWLKAVVVLAAQPLQNLWFYWIWRFFRTINILSSNTDHVMLMEVFILFFRKINTSIFDTCKC